MNPGLRGNADYRRPSSITYPPVAAGSQIVGQNILRHWGRVIQRRESASIRFAMERKNRLVITLLDHLNPVWNLRHNCRHPLPALR